MKRNIKKLVLLGSIATVVLLSSFSLNKGGDVFQIYFNGNRILQQAPHADKSIKNLQVNASSENDRLDVYYSHCGQVGKNRFITMKDENEVPLHVWEFADAVDGNSAMSLTVKQVSSVLKNREAKFLISYSSKELPAGKYLATISLGGSGLAKR